MTVALDRIRPRFVREENITQSNEPFTCIRLGKCACLCVLDGHGIAVDNQK